MKWRLIIAKPTSIEPTEESIGGHWGVDKVTIDKSTETYRVGDQTITVTTRADVPDGPFITVEGHEPTLPPPFDRYFTIKKILGTTTVVHDVDIGVYTCTDGEGTVTQLNQNEREVIIRADTLRAAWKLYRSILNMEKTYFVTPWPPR